MVIIPTERVLLKHCSSLVDDRIVIHIAEGTLGKTIVFSSWIFESWFGQFPPQSFDPQSVRQPVIDEERLPTSIIALNPKDIRRCSKSLHLINGEWSLLGDAFTYMTLVKRLGNLLRSIETDCRNIEFLRSTINKSVATGRRRNADIFRPCPGPL